MDVQTSFLFDPMHIKYSPSKYLCISGWFKNLRSALVTGNTLLRTCEVVMTFPIYSEAFRFNKSSTSSSHIIICYLWSFNIFLIFLKRELGFFSKTQHQKTENIAERIIYRYFKLRCRQAYATRHHSTTHDNFSILSRSTDKGKVFYQIVNQGFTATLMTLRSCHVGLGP